MNKKTTGCGNNSYSRERQAHTAAGETQENKPRASGPNKELCFAGPGACKEHGEQEAVKTIVVFLYVSASDTKVHPNLGTFDAHALITVCYLSWHNSDPFCVLHPVMCILWS